MSSWLLVREAEKNVLPEIYDEKIITVKNGAVSVLDIDEGLRRRRNSWK